MRRLIIFLLIPIAVKAQTNYSDLLDKFMQAHVAVNQFSGTAIVIKDGNTIYEKSFGKADKEWNIDNTVETKYRIASCTKQFTAACVLLLEEQGKLKLEDKLSKYIPDYPKGDSITIHMLLNHTSGIKNYHELPVFWSSNAEQLPLSRDSMISFFKNVPLNFSPGTVFNYNNSGYFLLGCIIEKVSNEKYSDFLNKNIFGKLSLINSGYDRNDSILMYRARGYRKTLYGYENAPYVAMETVFSSGALYSTVEDLYKWNKALMNNQLLSSSSIRANALKINN